MAEYKWDDNLHDFRYSDIMQLGRAFVYIHRWNWMVYKEEQMKNKKSMAARIGISAAFLK